MKFVKLLLALSLSSALYTANAEEMTSAENDYITYCTEQADMSGIEDANEKSLYIKECIESFTVPFSDTPQQDQ